jgi:uncharacterized integral membrane protein (TIGR00698 family)
MDVLNSTKQRSKTAGLLVGLAIILVLAILTNRITHIAAGLNLPGKMGKALEYPLWAALLGLVVNIIVSATRTKDFIKPAIRTELFIKIGLVIMGVRVNIATILSAGIGGLIQALIMVSSVFFFTWWLGGKLKIGDKLRAVMSTAVSVCGVSAAIAAAGSVLAKKDELAYIIALIIATALPLMVLMPMVAHGMDMPADVAGGWFGGNIDTTAAVVGAGTIHSEKAQEIATIVKMSQNALIGVVAFLLALYFVVVVEQTPGKRPSARVIWDRFPKFVLGFVLASILASIGLFTADQIGAMKNIYKWAFSLGFICIGLELSTSEFKKMGWRPLIVYLMATVFNTLLAMGVAWVIFGILNIS